jgi:hypothetical protein
MNVAAYYSLASVVFMMAYVMVFDNMRYRHGLLRFAAVTGLPPVSMGTQIDLSVQQTERLLSNRDRAQRLYAMGEFAAAAELLAKEED